MIKIFKNYFLKYFNNLLMKIWLNQKYTFFFLYIYYNKNINKKFKDKNIIYLIISTWWYFWEFIEIGN